MSLQLATPGTTMLPCRPRNAMFRPAHHASKQNAINVKNSTAALSATRGCNHHEFKSMHASILDARQSRRRVITMAGKLVAKVKLALEAGKANPAPPVGPALGARGVNIMGFCKEYNAATAKMAGQIIPVEISIFDDRSFTFILKTPPASVLLKKAAGIPTGSGKPDKEKVGQVTREQILEIAKTKLPDTNATKVESVVRMIEGTAKNMGLAIVD